MARAEARSECWSEYFYQRGGVLYYATMSIAYPNNTGPERFPVESESNSNIDSQSDSEAYGNNEP